MALTTRRPTGRPVWPITLLAGAEKAGKSWACAEASGSDLIGRTLWVGIGEDDPDEYGRVPGADFEIVEHEGTYRSILAALTAAATEPEGDRPTLLVVDSMTRLWDLLSTEAQETANARARRRGKADDEAQITMDLWNAAKDRWADALAAIRSHKGPVLLTARLEQVAVVDSSGKPTTDKTWKIRAEKNLPFEVGAIVEMPARGETWVSGLRSVTWALPERTKVPGFTVDAMWRRLGLADGAETTRAHSAASTASEADRARVELREWCDSHEIDPREAVARWAAEHDDTLAATTDADGIRAMQAAWQHEIDQQRSAA